MKYYKYKHWVNRGFFLGAKDSKVYGYLGWYNSSNGGQMPADYKPSSYSFRYAWYFPFTYLEYIELQKRIDLGYKKINDGLNVMTTVLNNQKPRFEEFNNKINEIEKNNRI